MLSNIDEVYNNEVTYWRAHKIHIILSQVWILLRQAMDKGIFTYDGVWEDKMNQVIHVSMIEVVPNWYIEFTSDFMWDARNERNVRVSDVIEEISQIKNRINSEAENNKIKFLEKEHDLLMHPERIKEESEIDVIQNKKLRRRYKYVFNNRQKIKMVDEFWKISKGLNTESITWFLFTDSFSSDLRNYLDTLQDNIDKTYYIQKFIVFR